VPLEPLKRTVFCEGVGENAVPYTVTASPTFPLRRSNSSTEVTVVLDA
jgi:hypothetical protein